MKKTGLILGTLLLVYGTQSFCQIHYTSTTANGSHSNALGYLSNADYFASVGIGYNCDANDDHAVAIGINCFANGEYSTALGDYNYANGQQSFACNNRNSANGVCSFAAGYRNIAAADYSFALGKWCRGLSTSVFEIGWGTSAVNRSNIFTVFNAGTVGIGTDTVPAGYTLAVDGKIRTREVRVDLEDWSDDVFTEDYSLRTLEELERFIELKRHLPDLPSEEEVVSSGISVGEMNAMLVKKIEELTLYVIAQNKKINELERNVKNNHEK